MSRLAACMRRLRTHVCLSHTTRRSCATAPSVDEVRAAYKVLGVANGSSYADVKRRYVELAKQHHPDVAASVTTTTTHGHAHTNNNGGNTDKDVHAGNRMVDINNAYSTVTRFHKSGQVLSEATAQRGDKEWARYAAAAAASSAAYTPWHEDVDAMMYEMMWEEMRRRGHHGGMADATAAAYADADADAEQDSDVGDDMDDGEAAYMYMYYTHGGFVDGSGRSSSNSGGGGSYRRPYYNAARPPRPRYGHTTRHGARDHRVWRNATASSSSSSANASNNNNNNNSSSGATAGTWRDADVQAMVHMYKDGKSFDFIANALGKDVAHVVQAFNQWSATQQQQHTTTATSSSPPRSAQSTRPRRHRGYAARRAVGGPYYHAESPDDVPFELYTTAYVNADDDADDDDDVHGDGGEDDDDGEDVMLSAAARHYGYNHRHRGARVDDTDPYGYCVYDDVYTSDGRRSHMDGNGDDDAEATDMDASGDGNDGGGGSRGAMPYRGHHYMHPGKPRHHHHHAHYNNNSNSNGNGNGYKSGQRRGYYSHRNNNNSNGGGGNGVRGQHKSRANHSAAYHRQGSGRGRRC